MQFRNTVLAVAALAAIAALARAGDGRSVEERLAALEGQVSRMATTVAAQNSRIAQLEAAATAPSTRSATPLPLVPTPAPPAMAEPPAAAPVPVERYVYATATGTKYHSAGCSYLRSSSIRMTLKEAIARGLTPCSRCGGR